MSNKREILAKIAKDNPNPIGPPTRQEALEVWMALPVKERTQANVQRVFLRDRRYISPQTIAKWSRRDEWERKAPTIKVAPTRKNVEVDEAKVERIASGIAEVVHREVLDTCRELKQTAAMISDLIALSIQKGEIKIERASDIEALTRSIIELFKAASVAEGGVSDRTEAVTTENREKARDAAQSILGLIGGEGHGAAADPASKPH